MAENKPENVIVDVEEVYSKSETWVIENQKSLGIIAGAVVALILSYFAYQNFIFQPQENEAREYIWQAQQAFASDSFDLALNGKPGTDFLGFLEIIDNYGITEQANLANYYAGICYLRKGEYQLAIDHLESYDCADILVCAVAMGATGDAYMELGETARAIEYYMSAADHESNDFSTPIYLKKAAAALESEKKYAEAAELYQRIKDNHGTSTTASDIDKYIARAEAMAGA